MMDPVLYWMAVISIALLFLGAGWHKLQSPAYYRVLIQKYVPVSPGLAAAGQTAVGLVETGIAIGILIPQLRVIAAWLAAAVLFLYLLLMLVSLLRGLDMDCGCSGPVARQKITPWLLLRNAVLAGVAVIITLPVTDRTVGLADGLVITLAALVTVLCYISLEQLLANRDQLVSLRNS